MYGLAVMQTISSSTIIKNIDKIPAKHLPTLLLSGINQKQN